MSKQINIRVSDKQYDALVEKSEIYGMSITEYIKFVVSMDLKHFMEGREYEQKFTDK